MTAKYEVKITLVEGPPQGYTITATPWPGSTQLADGALSINHAGVRMPGAKW